MTHLAHSGYKMHASDPGPNREKLLDFTALVAWLTASLGMAVISVLVYGQDFKSYYAAGRVILSGGNPYDYGLVAAVLVRIVGSPGNHPFLYPLWFGWLMTPLSLLPYQAARAVWMGLNTCLWIWGLWRLSQLLNWPAPGWRRYLIFLFATFLFAWMTWRFEQVGILIFALLVAALSALRRNQWALAGWWLALMLIKPTVTILPVSAILIWLARQRHWRTLFATCISLAGLTLLATALTPDWYQPWLRSDISGRLFGVLDAANGVEAVRINTTLLDWLARFPMSNLARLALYGVVLAAVGTVMLLIVFRSRSLMIVVVASVIAAFVVAPYALQYDFPMLTLPLFWTMALFVRSRSALYGGLALTAFIASVMLWERPISDAYWMVIGITALAVWTWLHAHSWPLPEALTWTFAAHPSPAQNHD